MTTPLTITSTRRPDGQDVLVLSGEIDMSNRHLVAGALDRTSTQLVLDLSQVTYLDSAGLAVLFTHAHHIELIANPDLAPVLEISKLTGLTTVHGLGADSS